MRLLSQNPGPQGPGFDFVPLVPAISVIRVVRKREKLIFVN
jgi:hypothetical protein